MPRSRKPYPPEFRQQMVELVRAGRTPEELSREYEPTAQSIWNWVRQAERDGGTRYEGLTTEEKEIAYGPPSLRSPGPPSSSSLAGWRGWRQRTVCD